MFTLAAAAGVNFNCTVPSTAPPPPKTIAELHPAHVSLVMAVGDSITAAFAARSGIKEDRDISWSAGTGSATNMTLPWLIDQYHSAAGGSYQLEGASTESVIPKDVTDLSATRPEPLVPSLLSSSLLLAASLTW